MDAEATRKLLVAEYMSYLNICSSKGESVSDFPSDEASIKGLTTSEIMSLVRKLKDLARTPIT